MSTIYLVTGTTGEHSDRVDWNVKAFVEKPAAELFLVQLAEACSHIGRLRSRHSTNPVVQELCKLDPKWGAYYDVPGYEIEEIELVEEAVESLGPLFKPRPDDLKFCSETCAWGTRGSGCLQPEGHDCVVPKGMVYARRDLKYSK